MFVRPVRLLSCFALTVSSLACSLGAKTIINETGVSASPDGDGGTATTASASTTVAASTCTSGTFTKPDLSTLTACKTGGHCYAKDKMASGLAIALGPCDDPSELCVPDEILQANGTKLKQCTQPDSVKSIAGPGGGCVTIALLPPVQQQVGSFLKQQECDADQDCIPCINPQDNSASPFCDPIGVFADSCSAASDAGAATGDGGAAAAPAEPCCTTNGTSAGVCMSNTIIPPAQQGSITQDTCATTDVCMPAAMIQGKATKCDAGLLFGSGVCMDKCFNSLLEVAGAVDVLGQDVCGDTEVCTPCSILVKELPAGIPVPGCS